MYLYFVPILPRHSADLTWAQVNNIVGYQIVSKANTNALPTPAAWSTSAVATNSQLQLSGLMADVKYCVYIRTMCQNKDTSTASSICFATVCDSVTPNIELNIDPTDPTKATAKWASGVSSQGGGFEYAVTKSQSIPNGGLVGTTDSQTVVQGLKPNTNYCLHVRYICPVSKTFTKWDVKCFTTPPPAGVNNTDLISQVFIFPNPAHNTLYLSIPEIKTMHNVTICDITGKKVYSTTTDKKDTYINTAALVQGMYIINVSGKDYNINKRFNVEK